MPAPQRIKQLVENFKANFDHVQSTGFLEEDLRTNFLNPFFKNWGGTWMTGLERVRCVTCITRKSSNPAPPIMVFKPTANSVSLLKQKILP
jgi:hypothetical protein